MSPILGIWASQGRISNSYESIATVTVGAGGSSSVSFSSIPSTYKHLELRYIGRNSGTNQSYGRVACNGDTTSTNYIAHDLYGDGSSASASSYGAIPGIAIQKFPGTGSTSGIFGAGILTILDYTNTNKYKTARNLGGQDSNGSGEIDFVSSLWMNTSAITSLTITVYGGFNFAQYSSFALYGIKGA